jgi:hypothetical protein
MWTSKCFGHLDAEEVPRTSIIIILNSLVVAHLQPHCYVAKLLRQLPFFDILLSGLRPLLKEPLKPRNTPKPPRIDDCNS